MDGYTYNFLEESRQFEKLRQEAFYRTPLDYLNTSAFQMPDMSSINASLYDAMEGPRNAVTKIMASMEETQRLTRSHLAPFHEALKPLFDEGGAIAQIHTHQRMLEQVLKESRFRELMSSSRLADQIMASDRMRDTMSFALPDMSKLAAALNPLHTKYESWMGVLSANPISKLDALGSAIAIPSKEMVHTFTDVDILLRQEPERAEPEVEELPPLEDLLAALAPGLVRLYQAVYSTLEKRGDDYQRHAAASMRELLDHTFFIIAPNEKVRVYLAAQGKTMKDKPSWATRVEYALSSLEQPEFCYFMAERAKVMRLNVRVIQDTVHALDEVHSHAQLQHWIHNCEASLRNILEARHLALNRM